MLYYDKDGKMYKNKTMRINIKAKVAKNFINKYIFSLH